MSKQKAIFNWIKNSMDLTLQFKSEYNYSNLK